MPTLEGERILLTGAAQGLGAAIARHLHALSADLILLDRDAEGLEAIARDCPGARTAVVDLADADDTDRVLREVVTKRVDTMIHNAAVLRMESIEDVSLESFSEQVNVGIRAGFQLTQAVWPGMTEKGGTLVFVSSRSGIEGFVDETAYCAAKHALEGFSKCLAMEGEPHDIMSVTVTPGMLMHTPMSETTYPPEARAKWVDPSELAPAFSYLAIRPMHLSGERVSAWELSQEHPEWAPKTQPGPVPPTPTEEPSDS